MNSNSFLSSLNLILVTIGPMISATHFRSCNIDNKAILELAVEDFDICQAIHQEELQHLDRYNCIVHTLQLMKRK